MVKVLQKLFPTLLRVNPVRDNDNSRASGEAKPWQQAGVSLWIHNVYTRQRITQSPANMAHIQGGFLATIFDAKQLHHGKKKTPKSNAVNIPRIVNDSWPCLVVKSEGE